MSELAKELLKGLFVGSRGTATCNLMRKCLLVQISFLAIFMAVLFGFTVYYLYTVKPVLYKPHITGQAVTPFIHTYQKVDIDALAKQKLNTDDYRKYLEHKNRFQEAQDFQPAFQP